MFNDGNLLFERTADVGSVFGNTVANVKEFVFLMFKQQVNRLGFFIQSLNNIRNITDGVFGHGVENARLGFEGRDQLIMGRARFFYRFVDTFAVFVKQCTDFAAAFDDRGRQAVQFFMLVIENIFKLNRFVQGVGG